MAKSTKSVKNTKTAKTVKVTRKTYSTKTLAEKVGVSAVVVRNAIYNGVLAADKNAKNGRYEIAAAEGNKFARAMKGENKPATFSTITVKSAAKSFGKNPDTIRYQVKKGHVRSVKGIKNVARVSYSDLVKVYGNPVQGKTAEAAK